MTVKKCSRCQTELPITAFHKNRSSKDGHQHRCKDCDRAAHRETYARHKEEMSAKCRARAKANPHWKIQRQAKRKTDPVKIEHDRAKARERYWKNPEARRQYTVEYCKRYPEKARFNTQKRVAAQLQRTPPWVDMQELRRVFQNCPMGMAVDHIIPLRGKLVSGLHVPGNLQYLSKAVNSSKSNRFEPYIISRYDRKV